MTTIRVSVFPDAFEKVPIDEADLPWPDVAREIAGLVNVERARKVDMIGFHFGRLAQPYNVNANVTEHTALAVDVDTLDLPATLTRLQTLGVAAMVYETASSTVEAPRVRILAPTSRPFTPDAIKQTRRAFAEVLGIGPGQGVESAEAWAQLSFAGRLKGTPPRRVWMFEGAPVNVDALPPPRLAWKPERPDVDLPPLPRLDGPPDARAAALVHALTEHWEGPGGNPNRRPMLRALGGYLARRGWDDDQIAAAALALPTIRSPERKLALVIDAARQARRDPEGTAGWSSLVAWNPSAAQSIEACAKDPREPAGWPGVWSEWWARYLGRQRTTPTGGTIDGEDYDWDAAEVPIAWYCRELAIAPSERKVTLIAGAPGASKGPLANYLATCFAFGLRAFGEHPCRECRVGVLDFEGARLTARRLRSYVRGFGLDPKHLRGRVFLKDCDPGMRIEQIRAWVVARGIEVVIVDSYMSAMSASDVDPNSAQYADLARDLGALGIVVIVVAHARKIPAGGRPTLGDVAGSYALAGMAATAIAVWRPNEDDAHTITLACLRAPEEAFQSFDLRWEKGGTDAEPAWVGKVAGAATHEAREGRAETDARAKLDADLSWRANAVIGFMWAHRATPRTANAIKEGTQRDGATVHDRLVPAVMSALREAGMVCEYPGKNGAKGTWVLTVEGAERPYVAIRDGAAVRVAPPDLGGKFHA